MYSNRENRSHPLLEQVPLTVSPFISLPTATTLSYNYKTMPSTIPPSSLGIPTAAAESEHPSAQQQQQQQQQQPPKPRYIISKSGHAAGPDDIISTCRALGSQVAKMQEDAERELRGFEERIRERDLAEKRRLAPGWLDSEARLLEPERSAASPEGAGGEGHGHDMLGDGPPLATQAGPPGVDEGAELDRVFGGMALK